MRGLVYHLYAFILRGQALIGLGLVIWLMTSVPNALSKELYIGVPLAGAVIVGVVSIALLWPYLTPNWLGNPTRLGHLLPIVTSHAILPFLYIFVAMSAVVASGIDDPLGRQLSVGIALVLVTASMILWGLGTALCCMQDKPPQAELDNVVGTTPAKPVPVGAAEAEFEALRQSRMSAS